MKIGAPAQAGAPTLPLEVGREGRALPARP